MLGKHKYNNLNNSYSNNKLSVNKNLKNITIDETKVVLDINTKDLQKKYNNLGQVISTDTNIDDAINKLKNLKR